jgi:hypothetical protein
MMSITARSGVNGRREQTLVSCCDAGKGWLGAMPGHHVERFAVWDVVALASNKANCQLWYFVNSETFTDCRIT